MMHVSSDRLKTMPSWSMNEAEKLVPRQCENPGLPLDMNSDGYLDGKDTNWQVDEEKYPDSSIKLRKGSVFDNCFWVASATDQNNVASGVPTLQMQLLDKKSQVLKHWNVSLQEKAALQTARTVVTLDGNGQTVLSTELLPKRNTVSASCATAFMQWVRNHAAKAMTGMNPLTCRRPTILWWTSKTTGNLGHDCYQGKMTTAFFLKKYY